MMKPQKIIAQLCCSPHLFRLFQAGVWLMDIVYKTKADIPALSYE